MKPFQIVSVLVLIVSLVSLPSESYAVIQFYGADIDLSPAGNAQIKLTITFKEPVKGFQLAVFGSVVKFEAASNAGPVQCQVTSGAASIIDCKMDLTEEKRTLELRFETADFVRKVDSKSLFSLDLSLSQDIDVAAASVKLPEGYALTNTSMIPSVLPKTSNIISDGRRIIVNWDIANLTTEQSFKFQTLYEPAKNPLSGLLVLGIPGLVSMGIAASLLFGGGGFLLYRRLKKPREVILSVLDDFEKNVVQVITNSGGEINQRKVVHETNLSKAKVSRVVKRLQERGLLEVTRFGRTNKLKLVKKKFEGI